METTIREIQNGVHVYPKYVFYKFQSECILLDLQKNGHLYMKNLQYYIDLERETGDSAKGDGKECVLFRSDITLIANEGEEEQVIKLGECDLRNGGDCNKPVYCMLCIDLYDHISSFSYPIVETLPKFDNKILDGFNNGCEDLYVLIIANPYLFQERVKNKLNELSINYDCGFVTYRDTDKLQEINGNIVFNGPFCKREKYSYQKEFRYILDKKIDKDEYYDIYIGDISDISYLCKAEELFNDRFKFVLTLKD